MFTEGEEGILGASHPVGLGARKKIILMLVFAIDGLVVTYPKQSMIPPLDRIEYLYDIFCKDHKKKFSCFACTLKDWRDL